MTYEDVATFILCVLAKAKRCKLRRVQLRFSDLQEKKSYFAGLTAQVDLNTVKWNIYMLVRIMIFDMNTYGHSI